MFRCDRREALALGLAAATPVLHAQTALPLPALTFFDDWRVRNVSLSPSGDALAMVAPSANGRQQLVVVDLATMAARPVAGFSDADVGWVHWLGDERLAFGAYVFVDYLANRYSGGLYAVDRDGRRLKELRPFERQQGDSMNVDRLNLTPWSWPLLAAGAQRGTQLLMVEPDPVPRRGEALRGWRLRRVDTVSLEITSVDAPRSGDDFVVGLDGTVMAALTHQDRESTLQVRGTDGRWNPTLRFDRWLAGGAEPLFAAPDGTLYVSATDARGMQALFRLDRQRGVLEDKPVLAVQGFDIKPQFVASDDRVLGLRLQADAEVTQWWDDELKAVQAEIDRRLASTVNRVTPPRRGSSPWLLVESFSDRQPMQYLLWNRKDRRFVRVGAAMPQVDPARMAQTDFVRFKARDGLEIPAYVTRPPQAPAGARLPVVVYIHGGPWVRGGHWHWRPEWQFLASRGYLVVAPEFRGSAGFGSRHEQAGYGQWGQAMQDDIADTAAWAVASAGGDAARVAALGGSYGGYAALMSLVRHPQQFRCAVSLVGVTDPLLLFDEAWSDISSTAVEHGLKRKIGDPETEAEKLRAASPLHQASRITAPVLLAYGERDRRVTPVHAERLERALRGHNKAVELVRYPEEGHGLRKPENLVDFWTRVEKFLARHMPAA